MHWLYLAPILNYSTMKKNIILIMNMLFIAYSYSQVGIGTTTPDGSASLDISSTNSGLLIPRLNDAQRDAINNPATGLLIFNTNANTFQYNYGSTAMPSWYSLGSSSNNTMTEMSGYVQANGTFTISNGGTAVKESTGVYRIDFPMPSNNNQYAVIATVDRSPGRDDLFIGVSDRTIHSFNIRISDEDDGGTTNNYTDNAFSFNVIAIPSNGNVITTSANAHGYVNAATTAFVGNNATIAKIAAGHFRVTFDTAQSNTYYAVNASVDRAMGDDDAFIGIRNRTITSFDVFITDEDNGDSVDQFIDRNFSFVVH